MNIHEALNHVSIKRAEYFKWKHGLYFHANQKKKSEKDFLSQVQAKTLNGFLRWERSHEYKSLLILLLDSKVAKDFEEIYDIVSSRAKEGDEKYIKLFLIMQKDLDQQVKIASESLTVVDDVEEEEEIEEHHGLDLR